MKNGNYLGIYFYAFRQIEDLKSPHYSNIFSSYLQRYTSFCEIKHKNIFHLLSQCWLFTIFKQYKNDLLNKGILNYSEISFEDIFDYIMNTAINVDLFYQLFKRINAMEKEQVTSSLSNIKILYVFISKIEDIKKEEIQKIRINKNTIERKTESKEHFENIIITILTKGVNLSINEINKYEKHKDNLLLFNIYNKVTLSSTNRSVGLSSNYIYQGLTRRKHLMTIQQYLYPFLKKK